MSCSDSVVIPLPGCSAAFSSTQDILSKLLCNKHSAFITVFVNMFHYKLLVTGLLYLHIDAEGTCILSFLLLLVRQILTKDTPTAVRHHNPNACFFWIFSGAFTLLGRHSLCFFTGFFLIIIKKKTNGTMPLVSFLCFRNVLSLVQKQLFIHIVTN